MLGPGGLMGLKLALLGTEEGLPGGAATSSVWDHTSVSLSYVNVLTLQCDVFHKCACLHWLLEPRNGAALSLMADAVTTNIRSID